MKEIKKATGSVVLYGVPRAYYGAFGGCTPLPICLTAIGQYIGRDITYPDMMTESGAGFRLAWNTSEWDGGNVDVTYTYADPWKPFELGMKALGAQAQRVMRDGKPLTPEGKQAFIDFCKPVLESGIPVLALGVIGPPEACIVTGYQEEGQVLLGWNLFQEYPELGGIVATDDSGYFVTRDWWQENTFAFFAPGEPIQQKMGLAEVLQNGIDALTGRQEESHAKGIQAYDAWKTMLLDDTQFPAQAILPVLSERMMCQGDAMDCLADGRYQVAAYLEARASELPDQADALRETARLFRAVHQNAMDMAKPLGGWDRGEAQMRKLALPDIRKEIAALIDKAKASDEQALAGMRTILSSL